jgi:BolA family transcriptional regulator, general stress-responsive regulator
MQLVDTIKARLAHLEASSITIKDDSAAHAGHKGNGGGGHFNLTICSPQFSQLSQIKRHRMIYSVLNDLIPQQIHAISILAIAPDDPK